MYSQKIFAYNRQLNKDKNRKRIDKTYLITIIEFKNKNQ
jgi:hypothetical protein